MVSSVAPGTACISTAHSPATCGAAIEVPLNTSYAPPGTEEFIESPGASNVRNGATLENDEILSSLSIDPTLTAEEMQAGLGGEFVEALLPEARTVTIPIARSASIAGLYGSLSQGVVNCAPPRLMF